ncbi:MAG: nitroreductase family protein [Pseudomonadota bacterium]
MNVFQAIYERRSIRVFDTKKRIPEDVILKMLNATRYISRIPTGEYPFRFIVINDQETRELIAQSAKEVAAMLFGASFEVFGPGHLWYLPDSTRLKVAEYTTTGELWTYPRNADLVLVPVYTRGAWVDTITNLTDQIDIYMQYLGMATQNMWLVGYKYGVGSAYNGMPLLDVRRRESVATELGLPWSWEPTGALCFGFPEGKRYYGPARASLEQVVFTEYWGVPYERIAFRGGDFQREKIEFPDKDVEEVVENLNFVDTFAPGDVPEWKIEKIMDCALWGPVPENFKNWRFVLIRDKESKAFIKKLAVEKIHVPWIHNWGEFLYSRMGHLPEDARLEAVERYLTDGLGKWIEEAETLILVLTTVFNWRDQPYPAMASNACHMFSISTGCVVQNMIVGATALDLGVNYEVWPCSDERSIALLMEYFGIPQTTWIPLGVLGIGRPGQKTGVVPLKRTLDSLFYQGVWGVHSDYEEKYRQLKEGKSWK